MNFLHELIDQGRLQDQPVMSMMNFVLAQEDTKKRINEKTSRGETALHIACRKSAWTIVEALLKVPGIDPHVKDAYGDTPLSILQALNAPEKIQKLFSREGRFQSVKETKVTSQEFIKPTFFSEYQIYFNEQVGMMEDIKAYRDILPNPAAFH